MLDDGINAHDLQAILARALDMCHDHNIDVQALTMDETSTNFSAMRKFGSTFKGGLDKMTGKFSYGKFDHPKYQ